MTKVFKRISEYAIDFLVPSERNGFMPRALGVRSFFYYGFLIFVVAIMLFSPLTKTLPWRVFLANLSQELILTQTNPVRQSVGISPLQVDPLLAEAARMKAEDMIARDYFSHIGPSGELPWKWIEALGYKYAAAGENLAIDFSDPSALVNAWMASPTHAANIQNGIFTDVGIGVAEGVFEGRNTAVVVMFLGSKAKTTVAVVQPSPPPAPLPAPELLPAPDPVSQPDPVPSPVPVEPTETSQQTVTSVPINTQAVRSDTPTISENVVALNSGNNETVELQKPLIVRTEEIVRKDVAVEESAEIVSDDKTNANTLGLFLIQAPTIARFGLSLFFASMFGVAVLMFMFDKAWAPRFISRASISLLLISALWIPEIL